MPDMQTQLLLLLSTALGALTVLVERIRRDLQENTTVSTDAYNAARAALATAMHDAEILRTDLMLAREALADARDVIGYLSARVSGVPDALAAYEDRRKP